LSNPKRYVSPVSIFFCHKMMAVYCFVWLVALRLWSVREAEEFRILAKKKISISNNLKVFLKLMLDELCILLFCKGDFHCLRCSYKGNVLGGTHYNCLNPGLNSAITHNVKLTIFHLVFM